MTSPFRDTPHGPEWSGDTDPLPARWCGDCAPYEQPCDRCLNLRIPAVCDPLRDEQCCDGTACADCPTSVAR